MEEAQAQCDDTVRYWRDWLSTGTFPDHPWRSYIERSALTLKGLSYAPTGAIMAAATTSLPETPGGARNWDYRYTWIRDSSFMLRSLYRLGFEWEALEYFAFVLEAVAGGTDSDWDLQIMYGIGGEKDLTEHTLDHLTGYRDSPAGAGRQRGLGPAPKRRVGHAPRRRRHLPAPGRGPDRPIRPGRDWPALVDDAIRHAGDPDQGIWEIRGDPQHFTASKVLCWVAMDRGSDLARTRQDHERAERWRQAADELKAEILDKGVDERGRFRQHYANDELDASLLLIPIIGFLPPDDERVRTTVLAIADELTEDGLVLRYKVDTTDTGLRRQGGDVHHLLVLAGDRPGHDRRAATGPWPWPRSSSPSPARCSCTPRRSTPPPVSTSATSRRPSPTWPSSTPSAASSTPSRPCPPSTERPPAHPPGGDHNSGREKSPRPTCPGPPWGRQSVIRPRLAGLGATVRSSRQACRPRKYRSWVCSSASAGGSSLGPKTPGWRIIASMGWSISNAIRKTPGSRRSSPPTARARSHV